MGAWLHAIGLGAHATAFEANHIDGAALVLLSREERLSARTLSRTRTRIRTLSRTRTRTLARARTRTPTVTLTLILPRT